MPDTLESGRMIKAIHGGEIAEELSRAGLEQINAQVPFARCDLSDTQEAGMVLTVNGNLLQLSEVEAAALNEKLNAALMRRVRLAFGG